MIFTLLLPLTILYYINSHLLLSEIANLINPLVTTEEPYCTLPNDPSIQPVLNPTGWATLDQKCKIGSWCPYSCLPGMYTAQWDTSIICEDKNHCGSTHGGIFCNNNKEIIKPRPNEPYCKQGLQNINLKNTKDQSISVCQTVYPGSEIMFISTLLLSQQENIPLTILPNEYWMNTGAHFYVNPINSNNKDCIWGNHQNHIGNWAPYLFGTKLGYQDNVYLRIGINPNNKMDLSQVGYQIKVLCESGECVNTPCHIGTNSTECIVTIKKDAKAKIIFY